jgi:hypothetical protein
MSMSFQKTDSGAVINTDLSEYERYKLQRQKAVENKTLQQKVDVLEREVTNLKIKLSQIESRLN